MSAMRQYISLSKTSRNNGTQELLVYADDVNLLGNKINAMKKTRKL
jgi:hypothetical protein